MRGILLDFNRGDEKKVRGIESGAGSSNAKDPEVNAAPATAASTTDFCNNTPDRCDIEREERRIVEARSNLDLRVIKPRSADREWPLFIPKLREGGACLIARYTCVFFNKNK